MTNNNNSAGSAGNDHWNEPVVVNEYGGKQSELLYRYDLIPQRALSQVAHVLYNGEKKYGRLNWYHIPTNDHLNHAMAHLVRFMEEQHNAWKFAPNTDEFLGSENAIEHLAHAACRVLFALEIQIDLELGEREL